MPSVQSVSSASRIPETIRQASTRTDTDFDYLLAQARIESSLNPKAKAPTSSAAGLYQFISQTWLETLNRHGEEHGLGWAAEAIEVKNGKAAVTDPGMRQQIMQLRFDPMASSLMAGELAGDNAAYLETNLGRPADHTELYLAHFLGAKGAERFITAHQANPGERAADLFPEAARANPSIFHAGGQPQSIGQVRDLIAAKMDAAGSASGLDFAPGRASGLDHRADGPKQAFTIARNARSQRAGSEASPAAFAPVPANLPPQQTSMAAILRETFGAADHLSQSDGAPPHVARAYRNLARFGL